MRPTNQSTHNPEQSASSRSERQQVYLFGTCLIDLFYPDTGMDALALLELCGFDVCYPPSQSCCGQPPYNSGYDQEARDIARRTVALFSEDRPLIVPSASCAGMIKYHYPKLLEQDLVYADKARQLAERCFELIDFIADRLPYEELPACTSQEALKVALHESCSAQREMKVSARWREIIENIPGLTLAQPAYAKECCGFGGTFAVKSAAVSAAMSADKAAHLTACQADMITSGDCGCLLNISGIMDKQGIQHQSLPLAKLIARRFGISHED